MIRCKTYISVIWVTIISGCLFSSGLFASTKEGATAFINQDYKTAYKELIEPSKAGDPRAQAILGDMYIQGLGVHADSAKAVRLFMDSANKGNLMAEYSLGLLYKYEKMSALKQNLPLAAHYLKKAADAGIAGAQFEYSEFLLKGLGGVRLDKQAGFKLLNASAKQNNFQAQWTLSLYYVKVKNVPIDEQTAFSYATKAAQKNSPRAQYPLAFYYAQGVATTKNPTKAFNLMRSSAEKGFPSAQYYLGIYYYNGFGTSKSINAAKYWIQKAAAQNMKLAQDALKNCFTFGFSPNVFCTITYN